MLPRHFLTPRLSMILEQVPDCKCLCDIGTDHAYIPIAAIDSGRALRAYATDVHAGPVKKARENIALYGFSKEIEVRLGDGLFPVLDTDADVIVIAGMGGCLITEILKQQSDFVSRCTRLILQPMREADVIRRFLCETGWHFEEKLVQEERRFYHILVVDPTVPFDDEDVDAWDLKFGIRWLNSDSLFVDALKHSITELKKIENSISAGKEQAMERKAECRLEREYLQKVVEQYETCRN